MAMYTPINELGLDTHWIDPYYYWATATNFADLPLAGENEVPILVEGPECIKATKALINRLRAEGVRIPLNANAHESRYFTAYARQSGCELIKNDPLSRALKIMFDHKVRWELSLPFASP